MKKTAKRIIALLLGAVLSLTLCTAACFADANSPWNNSTYTYDSTEDKTLPFNGEYDILDGAKENYDLYQMSGVYLSGLDSEADSRTESPLISEREDSSESDNTSADSGKNAVNIGDTNRDDSTAPAEGENSENGKESAEETTQKTSYNTNFFAALYEEIATNFGEIFSALSFAVTLIMMIMCKKRLLPDFRGAREAIEASYKALKCDTESSMATVTEGYDLINRRMECLEETVSSMYSSYLKNLERLEAIDDEEQRRCVKEILLCQVDMLYNVFVSSSLPEYQKDDVKKRIARMRESVAEND